VATAYGSPHRSRRCDHVVVSPGPWGANLLADLAPYIELRRPVLARFVAREQGIFEPDPFPCFARATPVEWYGLPSLDGTGIKLGLSRELNEVVPDPDNLDRSIPISAVQTFCELVLTFFPDVHPDPVRVTGYMEAYAPDGPGLVGCFDGVDRLTMIAGLSGHGFKLAPALGDIAADCALTGASSRNLEVLNPNRFTLSGSVGKRPVIRDDLIARWRHSSDASATSTTTSRSCGRTEL
jgi:sarcosine oxidase